MFSSYSDNESDIDDCYTEPLYSFLDGQFTLQKKMLIKNYVGEDDGTLEAPTAQQVTETAQHH